MNSYQSLPQIIQAIGAIRIIGNITPDNWYKHIKTEAGKPDMIGVAILAEIINWYQPLHSRDEQTGQEIYKKRFAADKLQTDISYYVNKFGLGKDQVKKALIRLEKSGYITKELRNIKHNDKTLNNRMFIEPIPQKILEITFVESQPKKHANASANSHHPSCKKEASANSHHPSCQNALHTITTNTITSVLTEKDDRQEKPDLPIAKTEPKNPQNLSSSVKKFDFGFDDFRWPSNIDKIDSNLQILARLPDNDIRQQVLDVFAQESQKKQIENKAGYLNAIVNNALKDDFTPITQHLTTSQKKQQNQDKQAAIDVCPYCDETGAISFKHQNEGREWTSCNTNCSHPSKVNWNLMRDADIVEITSAEPNYRLPPSKNNNNDSCNYCNAKGELIIKDCVGDIWTTQCSHDERKIRHDTTSQTGANYNDILSAKEGYKKPWQLTIRKPDFQSILKTTTHKSPAITHDIEHDHKIDECPYCTDKGQVIIVDQHQNETIHKCRHPKPSYEAWEWGLIEQIPSAKKGYKTELDHQYYLDQKTEDEKEKDFKEFEEFCQQYYQYNDYDDVPF